MLNLYNLYNPTIEMNYMDQGDVNLYQKSICAINRDNININGMTKENWLFYFTNPKPTSKHFGFVYLKIVEH